MRFMILLKGNKDSEAGALPDAEFLAAMGKYTEELAKAGVLIEGEGLHPTSKGAIVRFSGDKQTVIDGPFAESKEMIAGFWMWQCQSKQEAIDWVKRCPKPAGETEGEVEIRQVFEASDFAAALEEQAKRAQAGDQKS